MDVVQSLMQAASTSVIPLAKPTSYAPVISDGNGILYARVVAGSTPVDSLNLTGDGISITNALAAGAAGLVFNGATWDRVRGANVFFTAFATASGNTAVWTPQPGKKFRLMAWRLSVAGTLAADGTQVIQLRDGAITIMARAAANVAAALPSGDTQIGEDYGSLGRLSTAADNVLNINLGTAMASGAVYIDVWGQEE